MNLVMNHENWGFFHRVFSDASSIKTVASNGTMSNWKGIAKK
jgi:hypothetical protein